MDVDKLKKVFEKQLNLYLLLSVLFGLVYLTSYIYGIFDGQFWGISTKNWFFISLAVPFFHHTYVWLCWRVQLHFKLITNLMPKIGFRLYAVGFLILFVSRFLVVIFLSIFQRGFNGV